MRYSPQTTTSLKGGGIGVAPTDTIYGIVCSALNEKAVEKVYEVRRRRPDKPCIILIADVANLAFFGIAVDRTTEQLMNQLWPGPVSIILPCLAEQFAYLHRSTHTLAFRVPADEELRASLRETGPLIAPSANPEGLSPAVTIEKAREYFSDNVDFYEDAGPRVGEPSTVLEVKNGKVVVLRQGSFRVPDSVLS